MYHDKKLHILSDPAAPKFGKLYFRKIRTDFQISGGPKHALDVKDETEEPSADWVEAVTRSRAALPSREKLNALWGVEA